MELFFKHQLGNEEIGVSVSLAAKTAEEKFKYTSSSKKYIAIFNPKPQNVEKLRKELDKKAVNTFYNNKEYLKPKK